MSNFLNILYEGEQAEDYKATKEYYADKEKDKQKRRDDYRYRNTKNMIGRKADPYAHPNRPFGNNYNEKHFRDLEEKDKETAIKANKKVARAFYNRTGKDKERMYASMDYANDATNRHYRRHPNAESVIENPDLI